MDLPTGERLTAQKFDSEKTGRVARIIAFCGKFTCEPRIGRSCVRLGREHFDVGRAQEASQLLFACTMSFTRFQSPVAISW